MCVDVAYICACMCMYVCMDTCACVWIHVHVYGYMCVCMCVGAYTTYEFKQGSNKIYKLNQIHDAYKCIHFWSGQY